MITVEVVSIGGSRPSRPMKAQIDHAGGTIGRSPDCSLVLLDEKRSVSRVHAEISYRDGAFYVVDQGTNPLRVNGAPLGKGNSTKLSDGDSLSIGPYELSVKTQATASAEMPATQMLWPGAGTDAAAASGNPFDDLFGAAKPAAAPVAKGPPPASSSDPFADLGFSASGAASTSPLAAPPAAPKASSDPFADLGFGPSTSTSPVSQSAGSAGAGGLLGLPDDFDPMAPPPSAAESLSSPLGADLPDDAFASLGSSPSAPGEGSLDALFGLSSGSSADPFASGPLGKPGPSGSGGTDSGLTQWLGGIKKPAEAAPTADNVPELRSAFVPPRATTPIPTASELPGFDEPLPVPAAPAPGLPPVAKAPAPTPMPMPMPMPTPTPMRLSAASPQPQPASPPSVDSAAMAGRDPLQALLAGLNAQGLEIHELTPELLFKLGSLMHEAVSGTLGLLSARGTIKREMRADVTMIASGRNNPLKFSPDAGLALRYLFGPPMPGFMAADEAMRDAYNDLRAHELGFMAGLRAGLGSVLKRFEPEQLESRLPDKGGLNALMPANRKAKLWDLFGDLYRQVSQEADEDFHALFGREFLRAYEEHVEAMERGQPARPKK